MSHAYSGSSFKLSTIFKCLALVCPVQNYISCVSIIKFINEIHSHDEETHCITLSTADVFVRVLNFQFMHLILRNLLPMRKLTHVLTIVNHEAVTKCSKLHEKFLKKLVWFSTQYIIQFTPWSYSVLMLRIIWFGHQLTLLHMFVGMLCIFPQLLVIARYNR